MKYLKSYRAISIIAYFVIILKGQIIGLPFLLWLAFTIFDFGNINQVLALMAVLGLILIFRNWNKARTRKILLADFSCFILLTIPIIGRLNTVPLNMFNYGAFIIPTTVFVLCYLTSLIYSCKQYLVLQKATV
ncbi:putative membrane protein [Mucilaginibacter pocheonensis]|uniref:Membrane protein n=1 Tax=Mucilaginibacter pocheonensis TaxID=398050 RepID=A0ABU1TH17_9SPHI|nr:putative membrane protein [Mucilaginibacter pocheonensis]